MWTEGHGIPGGKLPTVSDLDNHHRHRNNPSSNPRRIPTFVCQTYPVQDPGSLHRSLRAAPCHPGS